jgi:hypothetical protein
MIKIKYIPILNKKPPFVKLKNLPKNGGGEKQFHFLLLTFHY